MVERLNVFAFDRFVGTLSYDDHVNAFEFKYDASYLSSPDARELSQSLPLGDQPFDVLKSKAFFENLLPPEVVRRRLEKIVHISYGNVFGYLKALGGDCAGAVSLYEDGVVPSSVPERLKVLSEEEADELLKILPQRPLLIDKIEGYRISGAGAQDKLIARWDGKVISLPLYGTASTHIIKPPMTRFPETVANECFCQRLALKVGLPAAESGILKVKSAPYYWTKRFDRVEADDGVRRLHQEDFCQMMGYFAEQKYEFEGGPSLVRCLRFLRTSRVGAAGMLRFLDYILFGYLIGNADAHGKNYAILYNGSRIEIAPQYDLMSTMAYPELADQSAMRIGGAEAFSKVRRDNFRLMAEKSEIDARLVFSRLDDMSERIQTAATELAVEMSDEGNPSPVYARIGEVIREQAERVS
ncbi:MAG: type II toxin-antitoxin system HipA family toxin [bacterium]|nr:type II toxin-antitoxin system HipA family toxin [Candidatus Colisoma equi]